MTTRCKFVVEEIVLGRYSKGAPTRIKFSAVYPNPELDGYKHDENHAFFNATPYGQIEIHVQNAHAAELFQPGEEFYVDFTPAAKPEATE
jgi:hypothetical protein